MYASPLQVTDKPLLVPQSPHPSMLLFCALHSGEKQRSFSGYVGEVSTPLALVHEHKHTRIPNNNPKALKDFHSPQNSTDWPPSVLAMFPTRLLWERSPSSQAPLLRPVSSTKKRSHSTPFPSKAEALQKEKQEPEGPDKVAHRIVPAGCTGVCYLLFMDIYSSSVFQFTELLSSCSNSY